MTIYFFLLIIGIAVGIMGSVLGIGGGVIIVPALMLILNMPIHEAIAASLIVITANSLSSSVVYIRSGQSNLNLGLLLAIAACIGALFGSYIAVSLSQKVVVITLGCTQIFVAYLTYMRTRKVKQYTPLEDGEVYFFSSSYIDKSTGENISYKPVRVVFTSIISCISGVTAGLTGAGGGVFIIPAMNLASSMPIKAATATSTFIIGFTAAAAGLVYMNAGFVKAGTVSAIVIGVFLGTAISVKFFSKVTDKKVSYMFIALLLIIATQMLYKGFNL